MKTVDLHSSELPSQDINLRSSCATTTHETSHHYKATRKLKSTERKRYYPATQNTQMKQTSCIATLHVSLRRYRYSQLNLLGLCIIQRRSNNLTIIMDIYGYYFGVVIIYFVLTFFSGAETLLIFPHLTFISSSEFNDSFSLTYTRFSIYSYMPLRLNLGKVSL